MSGQFSAPQNNTTTETATTNNNGGNGRRQQSPGVYFNLDLEVAKGVVISLPYGVELDEFLAKKQANGNLTKVLEMLLDRLDELPAGEQEIELTCPVKVRVRPNATARNTAEADASNWSL